MKEYKIDLSGYDGKVREVVSEAIQRHAFKLGYEWRVGKEILGEKSPYLFFYKSSTMTHLFAEDVRYFEDNSGFKISAADFLSLTPEDVQDEAIVTTEPAEWLLVTGGESLTLVPKSTRVVKINGSGVLSVEPFTRTVAERFLPKEGK